VIMMISTGSKCARSLDLSYVLKVLLLKISEPLQ